MAVNRAGWRAEGTVTRQYNRGLESPSLGCRAIGGSEAGCIGCRKGALEGKDAPGITNGSQGQPNCQTTRPRITAAGT